MLREEGREATDCISKFVRLNVTVFIEEIEGEVIILQTVSTSLLG